MYALFLTEWMYNFSNYSKHFTKVLMPLTTQLSEIRSVENIHHFLDICLKVPPCININLDMCMCMENEVYCTKITINVFFIYIYLPDYLNTCKKNYQLMYF